MAILRPKAPERKKALLKWANRNGVPLPRGFKAAAPYVGKPARKLIVEFQRRHKLKQTGTFNPATLAKLMPYKPRIVRHRWVNPLRYSRRIGKPPYLVVHNAAAVSATVEAVNSWHNTRGFTGIGYHRYITKKGVIHIGRPLWAMGAHTLHWNHCIGICCEGNYDLEKTMPKAQLMALKWQVRAFRKRYPGIVVRGHREMPGNATSCPGKHFPLGKLR